MNWEDYVVLAKDLVGRRVESCERGAASLAYFGAFNESRRWLEANGASVGKYRAHSQVWRTFQVADSATLDSREDWSRIADLGNSLRALRNEADYDDVVVSLGRRAVRAVESAEAIIELLGELEVAD